MAGPQEAWDAATDSSLPPLVIKIHGSVYPLDEFGDLSQDESGGDLAGTTKLGDLR